MSTCLGTARGSAWACGCWSRRTSSAWWGKVRERLDERAFAFIGGESLKNVPKGYPPDHAFAEDLKRKGCAAGLAIDVTIDPEELVDQVEGAFLDGWPLMKFLCATLELPL